MATFLLMYFAFSVCVLIACIVVIFHLMRYSLDRKVALWTTIIFVSVTIILVLINLLFFINIPFADLELLGS